MRPIDIYNQKPKRTSRELYELSEWVSEIEFVRGTSDRVEVREHFFHAVDYRRYIRVCSVWFDGKPVMLAREAGREAGREGDDARDRFVTDAKLYGELLGYLASRNTDTESVTPDADLPQLNTLYGHDFELSDFETE